MISYIEPQIKENGHKFPKIQNVKGTKYVHKLFCKLKKDDKIKAIKRLDDFIS